MIVSHRSPNASAMSGVLKRKYEEVEEDPCYSSSSPSSLSSSAYSEWDSEGESCYSDTLDSTPSIPSSPATSFNSEFPLDRIIYSLIRVDGQTPISKALYSCIRSPGLISAFLCPT